MSPSRTQLFPLVALVLFAALAVGVACSADPDAVHPSYDRCAAGDTCGLGTSCEPAALQTTDAGVARFCTHGCAVDGDCPGFAARCVVTGDGGVGQCFRECARDLDCRAGSTCHGWRLAGVRTGLCVPHTGVRRCNAAGECAPYDDVCDGSDAGASFVDAGGAGVCRASVATSP